MKDPEEILRKLDPTAPSAVLDKRMDNLFSAALARTTPGIMRRPVPLWACAVLCGVSALLVTFLTPEEISTPEPVIAPADEVPYTLIVVELTDEFPAHIFDLTQYDELSGVDRQTDVTVLVSGAYLSEPPTRQRSSDSEVTKL